MCWPSHAPSKIILYLKITPHTYKCINFISFFLAAKNKS